MRYIVMIRRTVTGYSADVPDLPGCAATGLTVEHTRQQIAEAVEGHLLGALQERLDADRVLLVAGRPGVEGRHDRDARPLRARAWPGR